MSIKPLRFSELSDELADAVGLYEAVAMDLDEIDTSILDHTLIADVDGGGEEVAMAGGAAEEGAHMAQQAGPSRILDQRAADNDNQEQEPAPVTPQLDMAFTSASRAPIAPPIDLRSGGITSTDTMGAQATSSSSSHRPAFFVQNLTQLSWLRGCGVGVLGESEVSAPGDGAVPVAMQPTMQAGTSTDIKKAGSVPAPLILANSGRASAKVKRSRFGHRKDAPAMRQPGRGSLQEALNAGLPEHRASALARLEQDEVARSGVGPKRSRWKTWCRLHHNWFGKAVPALPLTMEKLAAVIAQLKEGKYHAAADYASNARVCT